MEKGHGQTLELITLKGEEFKFVSPNSDTIAKLMAKFLNGLRQRTKYAIGLEDFTLQGEGVGEAVGTYVTRSVQAMGSLGLIFTQF